MPGDEVTRMTHIHTHTKEKQLRNSIKNWVNGTRTVAGQGSRFKIQRLKFSVLALQIEEVVRQGGCDGAPRGLVSGRGTRSG